MNKLFDEYLAYIDSDEEFYYKTRMERDWNDEAYTYFITLTLEVIEHYKPTNLVPIPIVLFFTSTINYLIGTISHLDFIANCSKEYSELVDSRKEQLITLQKQFFSGELFAST